MITAARREAFEAELDEIAKIMSVRKAELTNPLVEKHLAFHDTVMVDHGDRRFARKQSRHHRRYRDQGGYYVRMDKRGVTKRYLSSCQITFINGEAVLFQYRLREG